LRGGSFAWFSTLLVYAATQAGRATEWQMRPAWLKLIKGNLTISGVCGVGCTQWLAQNT
jgi:hypothetical protein